MRLSDNIMMTIPQLKEDCQIRVTSGFSGKSKDWLLDYLGDDGKYIWQAVGLWPPSNPEMQLCWRSNEINGPCMYNKRENANSKALKGVSIKKVWKDGHVTGHASSWKCLAE